MRAKFDLFNKADGWNLNRFFFRNIFVSSSSSPCLACINYESSIVDISEKPIANFQIKVEFFSMIGKKILMKISNLKSTLDILNSYLLHCKFKCLMIIDFSITLWFSANPYFSIHWGGHYVWMINRFFLLDGSVNKKLIVVVWKEGSCLF